MLYSLVDNNEVENEGEQASNWVNLHIENVKERSNESAQFTRRILERMTKAVVISILLILITVITRPYFGQRSSRYGQHRNAQFWGNVLRSNGTHDFKRTVLMVSIDGLRADYLDRGLTPHLLDISKKGLRAQHMKPIFPTLTFPNHWSLMTGLYAESHGIVGNNFWDPESETEFHYNQENSTWNASWWFGEPLWESAGRAGLITANLMWPGPPRTRNGGEPTYFVPWKDNVSLEEKTNQIMGWIDLSLDERPQLILAYEPSLDEAGHLTGPNSALVNQTLREVDAFAKDLHAALEDRNLTDIVDIVFVSDHGMTDTSNPELVYLDDILREGQSKISHVDGWPSMGLRFSPDANESYYLELLKDAASANPEKFSVYTHKTMPEKYHFSRNPRIAPIYLVPKIGYALTTRKEGNVGMQMGSHGYDNNESNMHAIFVARGPLSSHMKDIQCGRMQSGHFLRRFLPSLSSKSPGWYMSIGSTNVIDGFQNVEIYGLIMKLLGIEKWSAKNNGTAGYWDQYF